MDAYASTRTHGAGRWFQSYSTYSARVHGNSQEHSTVRSPPSGARGGEGLYITHQ